MKPQEQNYSGCIHGEEMRCTVKRSLKEFVATTVGSKRKLDVDFSVVDPVIISVILASIILTFSANPSFGNHEQEHHGTSTALCAFHVRYMIPQLPSIVVLPLQKLMTSEESALANGFLEPLPTLNLVGSIEKLDAGLRSLDHCEYYSCSFGECKS